MKLKHIAPSQTEVQAGDTTLFFSYSTCVACHIQGLGYFRTSKKWSATTTRHINKWLAGAEAAEKEQSFFDELGQIGG